MPSNSQHKTQEISQPCLRHCGHCCTCDLIFRGRVTGLITPENAGDIAKVLVLNQRRYLGKNQWRKKSLFQRGQNHFPYSFRRKTCFFPVDISRSSVQFHASSPSIVSFPPSLSQCLISPFFFASIFPVCQQEFPGLNVRGHSAPATPPLERTQRIGSPVELYDLECYIWAGAWPASH